MGDEDNIGRVKDGLDHKHLLDWWAEDMGSDTH